MGMLTDASSGIIALFANTTKIPFKLNRLIRKQSYRAVVTCTAVGILFTLQSTATVTET